MRFFYFELLKATLITRLLSGSVAELTKIIEAIIEEEIDC